MLAEIAGEDVADRVEVGAAVMRDDALGIAGGARGVAQRNGFPFVGRQPGFDVGIALGDRRLIFDFANAFSAGKGRVVDVDDKGLRTLHQRQRFRDHARKFRIDHNDLGAAMVELERDRGRIEPDIERIQNGAGHRRSKMQFIHRRGIRQHGRHRIAVPDAAAREPRREAAAARVGFGPGEALAFIDRAEMIGINGGGARQKA